MTDLSDGAHFAGLVYRAHHPRWAYAPTAGDGAARRGGRFNRVGRAALYTSLTPQTAWMEAQQGFPFKAQPMTLVAYRVDCARIVRLIDPDAQASAGIDAAVLSCAWEALAASGTTPPSWELADSLIAAGAHGALVPSFAPGTSEHDRNLVLWVWSETPPCSIVVIDDFGRLPQDDASWR